MSISNLVGISDHGAGVESLMPVDMMNRNWMTSLPISSRRYSSPSRRSFLEGIHSAVIGVDFYYATYTPLNLIGRRVDAKLVIDHVISLHLDEDDSGSADAALSRRSKEKKIHSLLTKMEAKQSTWAIRFLGWFLSKVWRGLFASVQVDRASLLPAMKAMDEAVAKNIPILLLPTHKSHIDYLVLSYTAFGFGLPVPHIAAGDNLDIPIVGPLFRYSGSFFIRRKIGKDELYKLTLSTYVKQLLRTGACIEFFIEGGRSRSGKVANAKLGLLETIIGSVASGEVDDVLMFPISVDYDMIPETADYRRMLLGEPKQRETLWGLIKAAWKLLFRNHGSLYVTYGKGLSCKELIRSHTNRLAFEDTRTDSTRPGSEIIDDSMVSVISQRIGSQISEAMTHTTFATPSTLFVVALLSAPRDAWLNEGDLVEGIKNVRRLIATASYLLDIPVKHTQKDAEAIVKDSFSIFKAAIKKKVDETTGCTMYIVNDKQSALTDLGMYRNMVAHLMLPLSIVFTSRNGGTAVHVEEHAKESAEIESFLTSLFIGELPSLNLSDMVGRAKAKLNIVMTPAEAVVLSEQGIASVLELLGHGWQDSRLRGPTDVVAILDGFMSPLLDSYSKVFEALSFISPTTMIVDESSGVIALAGGDSKPHGESKASVSTTALKRSQSYPSFDFLSTTASSGAAAFSAPARPVRRPSEMNVHNAIAMDDLVSSFLHQSALEYEIRSELTYGEYLTIDAVACAVRGLETVGVVRLRDHGRIVVRLDMHLISTMEDGKLPVIEEDAEHHEHALSLNDVLRKITLIRCTKDIYTPPTN